MSELNFPTLQIYSTVHNTTRLLNRTEYYDDLPIFKPRPMQENVLRIFNKAEQNHLFLQACTGSGKSNAAKFISSKYIAKKEKRMLVVIPMKSVAPGFREKCRLVSEGIVGVEDYSYEPHKRTDFAHDDHNGSKFDLFVEWLKKSKEASFADNSAIGIITHNMLIALQQRNMMHLIEDFFVNIDEVHHSAYSDIGGGNYLGKALNYMIENDAEKNITIMLTSATPSRSDTFKLMKSDYNKRFMVFDYSTIEFFDDAEFIKGFDWKVYADNKDWDEIVSDKNEEILCDGDRIIISLPGINRKISKAKIAEERHINIQSLLLALGHNSGIVAWDKNGVAVVKLGYKNYRILNLVELQYHTNGLKYIDQNPEDIDILLNVQIFSEGANWALANKALIVGERNSMVQLVQIIGRIFRDVSEKEHRPVVNVMQVLPNIDMENTDHESFNSILKAVSLALVYIQVQMPIDYVVINNGITKKRCKRFNHINAIKKQLSFNEDPNKVLYDIQLGVGAIIGYVESHHSNLSEGKKSKEKIKRLTKMLSEEYNIMEDTKRIAEIYILVDKKLQMLGTVSASCVDVSELDYNMLDNEDIRSIYMGGLKPKQFIEWYKTNQKRFDFVSYEDAQKIVQSAGIKTSIMYDEFVDICEHQLPHTPHKVYEQDWVSWGMFLYNKNPEYASYERASELAQAAGIKTRREYLKWFKTCDERLTSNPELIYKEDWVNIAVFLGKDGRDIVPYNRACELVRAAGITSRKEYSAWYKTCEERLPTTPGYKDDWISWSVFLDTDTRKKASYNQACELVRAAGIKSANEYLAWYKTCDKILPSTPRLTYKSDWISWANFLGKECRDIVSYARACELVRDAGITSHKEYADWYKTCNERLPAAPYTKYKEDWVNFGVFWNTEPREYVSYEHARELVIESGITSHKEYFAWYKTCAERLPRFLYIHYKEDWVSLPAFLGK